ncbi:MAG: hypothetical protein FWG02_08295 [Holophagaceae bacterium]|nr:hypothetical protein [Holophagaceae bacterium]
MKRLFISLFALFVFCSPLFSQAEFDYALSRQKGNKIVILGEWKSEDSSVWKDIIESDGIYEHDFILLDAAKVVNYRSWQKMESENFEPWFRQRYDLSNQARWVALDLENKLIVSGIQTPTAKEFGQMLDNRGIKSPLRKVRDFLLENPNHIDAKTDLLTEVRRRALHVLPPDTVEDLDTETDLRTWGVLAAETDRVFSGSWRGVDLNFFQPHKDQPERFSKLMKNVFRKHIAKLESAVQSDVTDEVLWNIWAWMARSSPDYKWTTFISSIVPLFFSSESSLAGISSPPADVCVWIVDESRKNKNWETVIKFARQARGFTHEPGTSESRAEWMPGGHSYRSFFVGKGIDGHPIKTAYVPHLEALLRTGNIEEANIVCDEMMRNGSLRMGVPTNLPIAIEVAKSVGMEELAQLWGEEGRYKDMFQKIYPNNCRSPFFVVFEEITRTPLGNGGFSTTASNFQNQFRVLNMSLSPRLPLVAFSGANEFGWKNEDGPRWGLFSADAKLLADGSDIPDRESMQTIFSRNNIISVADFFRKYIAEMGSTPGIELCLAYHIIDEYHLPLNSDNEPDTSLADFKNEAAIYLRRVIDNPETLFNLPDISPNPGNRKQSMALKSISRSCIASIESLLERKPSDEKIWNQWLFWSGIEDAERPIEPLLERIKFSPLSTNMEAPSSVMDFYYEECKKNDDWPKIIKLLKKVWEREISIVNDPRSDEEKSGLIPYNKQESLNRVGNRVAIPLIEAYLHDSKFYEADDIFNTYMDSGGKFTDISKIVGLAKEKNQDRLVRAWETKVGK